jgi:hypothetical protein
VELKPQCGRRRESCKRPLCSIWTGRGKNFHHSASEPPCTHETPVKLTKARILPTRYTHLRASILHVHEERDVSSKLWIDRSTFFFAVRRSSTPSRSNLYCKRRMCPAQHCKAAAKIDSSTRSLLLNFAGENRQRQRYPSGSTEVAVGYGLRTDHDSGYFSVLVRTPRPPAASHRSSVRPRPGSSNCLCRLAAEQTRTLARGVPTAASLAPAGWSEQLDAARVDTKQRKPPRPLVLAGRDARCAATKQSEAAAINKAAIARWLAGLADGALTTLTRRRRPRSTSPATS